MLLEPHQGAFDGLHPLVTPFFNFNSIRDTQLSPKPTQLKDTSLESTYVWVVLFGCQFVQL